MKSGKGTKNNKRWKKERPKKIIQANFLEISFRFKERFLFLLILLFVCFFLLFGFKNFLTFRRTFFVLFILGFVDRFFCETSFFFR